ncbi:hypothetical protein [Comamonas sp. GB3 AK4-5]|uniref:hypothetical protein n=1 Tax=Comamonas sp. GB3 AK4-5 TaxID=3231487 RepID=UPI00351E4C3C
MQKYKSNITTTSGAAIRNVPVTVLKEDGSLASIFLDRAGQVVAPNPMKSDADGTFYFYAANGRYSLRTTVDGMTVTDDDVVQLADPDELAKSGPIAEAIAKNSGVSGKVLITTRKISIAGTTDIPFVQSPAGGLMVVSVESSGTGAEDFHDIELYDGLPSVQSLRYHARLVAGSFADAVPVYCLLGSGVLYLRLVNMRADGQAFEASITVRHMFGG